MNSKFFRALAARLPLLLIASLLGGVVTSVPARAVACAEGSAAQNNIAVSPSHGQVFYIDTGVSPIIDATYVGYRVTNTTGATLSNHWVSLSNFTGGVVSLARPNDRYIQLPDIANNSTKTVYFLVKANTATRVAQTHTVKIFSGRPDLATPNERYACDFSFTKVAETIKAAANKVDVITVSGDGTPELGEEITVTAEGDTGTVGAGSADVGRILWFSPSAFSTFPTAALRLESVTLVVSDNNGISGNGNNELRYYKERLLVKTNTVPDAEASTNEEDTTTDDLVGKRYYRNVYKFRVIGKTPAAVSMKPVAQISSGTQIKHTDLSSTPAASINTESTAVSLTVTKSVTATTNLTETTINNVVYLEVPYKVTIDNTAASGSVVIDEVVDTPASGIDYVSGSVAVTAGTGTATAPVKLSSESGLNPQPLHFIGPFTVSSATNFELTYKMYVPKAGTATYKNSAVAYIGPQPVGANSSSVSIVNVITNNGAITSATASTESLSPVSLTYPATNPKDPATPTIVVLNGTVDPNGQTPSAFFEWSTNSNLSSPTSISLSNSVAGSDVTAFAQDFTGTAGTTYYYRIVALKNNVRYEGAIYSFTISEAKSPAVATTQNATSILAQSATLNGSIDPNLQTISEVRFRYGTASDLTGSSTKILYELNPDTDVETSTKITLTGANAIDLTWVIPAGTLSTSTTYYYRIEGVYTDGTAQTAVGSILSFRTGTSSQTITFNSLNNQTFSTKTYTVTATASSQLAPSYSSDTPAVCSVNSSTGVVTFTTIGFCVITASQAGNNSFSPAEPVSQQFEITASAITLDANDKSKNYNAADPTFDFTRTAGDLAAGDVIGSLTYTFTNNVGTPAYNSATVPEEVGSYTITPSAALFSSGSANNYTITYTTGTYTISKIDQPALSSPNRTVGRAVTITLTTTGGGGTGAVSYQQTAETFATGNCSINGDQLTTPNEDGTCTITATKALDRNYNVQTTTATITVNGNQDQTITFADPADRAWSANTFDIAPTASSTLAVTVTSGTQLVCTIAGFTITMVKAGVCTLTAAQGGGQVGNTTYNPAADVTQSFTISKAARTIVIKSKNDQGFGNSYDPAGYVTWGDAAPTLLSLATADDTDTKTYSTNGNSAGCTIAANGGVSFTGAGTCKAVVTITGNRYADATSAEITFTIGKKNQTITFNALNDMVVGNPDQTPTVSTDAPGLTPTLTIDAQSAAFCSLLAGKIKADAAGLCVVNANQAGNNDYNPANQVQRNLTVTENQINNNQNNNQGGGNQAPPPGPRIDSLSKNEVCSIGHEIIILGANFENSTVTLDGAATVVKSLTGSSITVVLPRALFGKRVIRVANTNGSDTEEITYVTVPKPRFQVIALPYMAQGDYISLPVMARYATSYRLSGSLPPGLSLDPVTGLISGTATGNGIFNFSVIATGICGETTQIIELDIDKPIPNAISHRIYFVPNNNEVPESAKESLEKFIEKAKELSPRNIVPQIYITGGTNETEKEKETFKERRDSICEFFFDEKLLGDVLFDVFIGSPNRIEIIIYWPRPEY